MSKNEVLMGYKNFVLVIFETEKITSNVFEDEVLTGYADFYITNKENLTTHYFKDINFSYVQDEINKKEIKDLKLKNDILSDLLKEVFYGL